LSSGLSSNANFKNFNKSQTLSTNVGKLSGAVLGAQQGLPGRVSRNRTGTLNPAIGSLSSSVFGNGKSIGKVSGLNGSLGRIGDVAGSNGNSSPIPKGPFDPIGNPGNGGKGPILTVPDKPIFVGGQSPIFDPGLRDRIGDSLGGGKGPILTVPDKPIFVGGQSPIFDPSLRDRIGDSLGGGIGGGNPPADPGNGGGGNPPADPGNGGGDPPADPGNPPGDPGNPPGDPGNPPADPGNPCDPPCDPPHCNNGWPFPVPFPVWGGYNGGYCGTTTVVQPIYTPVTQTVAVEPAAQPVAAQPIDLELLEVRQLDRGDLAKKLGPAYRVLLRNKTGEAVTQQFNVALVASLGRQATADSAFAISRVHGLEAGQTLSVDVRLPAKAFNMGLNADGQPVPFGWLTAVADSHQEVSQADRENDFTMLARGEIVMMARQ
jgi:hypothetical protein